MDGAIYYFAKFFAIPSPIIGYGFRLGRTGVKLIPEMTPGIC